MKKNYLFPILLFTGLTSLAQQEAQLREALQKNPNDVQANYSLSNLLWEAQKYPESVALYAKAVRLDPAAGSVEYLNLGYSFQSAGYPDSAMYYYEQSGIRFMKNNEKGRDNGWRRLVVLAEAEGDTKYFMLACDNLLKLDDRFQYNSEMETYNLFKELRDNPTADTYMKLGDYETTGLKFNEKWNDYMKRFDRGVKHYDQAVKLDPTKKPVVQGKMGTAIKGIADTYFDDGNYEDALPKYEQALKYTQKSPEIYSAIGYIKLEKLKVPDYKGAIVNFQKALALTTASMQKKDHLENIGLCYERLKDYPNAILYYEKGIAQEPQYAQTIHAKLARIYEAQGNIPKAKYHRSRS
ncbi:MAG: tetratricopeptide repeat protein [Bacteroidia bacterium]